MRRATRPFSSTTVVAGALMVIVAASLSASAVGGGRNYHNDALRVRSFDTPRNWDPAPQIGYPRVLVLATHTDGARLLLSAQHVTPRTTAIAFAGAARVTLGRQRFADLKVIGDGNDRARLEATTDGGRGLVRQVYLVDGDMAYVVTLFAPARSDKRVMHDFDDAVRSLIIAPLATGSDGDGGGDANVVDAGQWD